MRQRLDRDINSKHLPPNCLDNALSISIKVYNTYRFLAHLVMSLCNHALSVVSCCRHWHQCRHLCTAHLVTGLIKETSYLANICSYTPSIAHEILGQYDVYFLNGSHFSKFLYMALLSMWLNLEHSYLAQLCTYTGGTHRVEIMHLSIIFLKLRIFKKIHNLHFSSFDIYMPDTKFINDTHLKHTHTHTHTQKYRYAQTCIYRHTQTDIDIIFYILHFLAYLACMPDTNFIFGIPQTLHKHSHSGIHTHRYIHMYRGHWHTDTDIQRTQACLYTYIHMHTYMHINVHVGNC